MTNKNWVKFGIISEVAERRLSLIRFLAKNSEMEIKEDGVSIEDALKLTKLLCSKSPDTEQVLNRQNKVQHNSDDKHANELLIQSLKSQCKALEDKANLLEKQLQKSEDRSERFETSLLATVETVSHLANNRDVIMGQMLQQSKWHIKQVGQKEVLVLSKPVNAK